LSLAYLPTPFKVVLAKFCEWRVSFTATHELICRFDSVKRQVWNTCFNEGYQDGEAAGCNAAVGSKVKRAPAEM
jgi:hypothetical protein